MFNIARSLFRNTNYLSSARISRINYELQKRSVVILTPQTERPKNYKGAELMKDLNRQKNYNMAVQYFMSNPLAQSDPICMSEFQKATKALQEQEKKNEKEHEREPTNANYAPQVHQIELPKEFKLTFPESIPIHNTNKGGLLRWIFYPIAIYVLYKYFYAGEKFPGTSGFLGMKDKSHRQAEVVDTKFTDVLGCDEAKQELVEVVEYLRNPHKYKEFGAKMPKGVLLYGKPGTGKTLLAKAIAGEANVPFYFATGSEFDEVLVGLGARRIRNLFEEARNNAPCIVFIDEIEGLGGSRKRKIMMHSSDVLNQLLVEMDGFQSIEGVIVIGATNMAEMMDEALLRPGRFDKQVNVPLPDIKGRELLFKHYLKNIPTSEKIEFTRLAKETAGLTGADIANICNIAAIKAVNRGMEGVTMTILSEAYDDSKMGRERKSAVLTEEAKKLTAYHEGGHALVALFLTECGHSVRKATIIPRGMALGYVDQIKEGDEWSVSLKEMKARLAVCMAGRIAEELVFGNDNVTSGCSSDLQQATKLATHMVERWGYSDSAGKRYFSEEEKNKLSEETKRMLENEAKKILDEQYEVAKKILTEKRRELDRIAAALLEYETLSGDELKDILNGKKIRRQ